jgi:DNA primase
MYPQEFIDKLKSSVDIKKLIEEYTELKKVGNGIYRGHCPHPDHNDSDPSLIVWTKSQSWACMGCHHGKKTKELNELIKLGYKKEDINNITEKNYGSDCIAFIRWINKGMPWRTAVEYLANKYNIPLPTEKNQKLLDNKKLLAYSYMENLKGKPYDYLLNRGLSNEDCFNWGLGFDGERICFPLLDRYKNVLSFTKRTLNKEEENGDKYKNGPNNAIFNKSLYLYGIHNLDEDFNEIRITEGTMDVILANKYGVKNIVATLGTSFTEGHVEIIKHYNMTPVFIFDGDEAGLKAINKSIALLAQHNIYSKVLILPNKKDLADLANELKDKTEDYIVDNSITYGNYLINKDLSLYTSKINELKLQYYPKLISTLSKVPSEAEKKILKDHIKNTMNINI